MAKLDLKKMQSLKRTLLGQFVASYKRALGIIGSETEATPNLQVSTIRLPSKSFNHEAYISAKRRMHEIEAQKALVILESRHEKWKGAGGPL